MPTPEEQIADTFDRYFANFGIRMDRERCGSDQRPARADLGRRTLGQLEAIQELCVYKPDVPGAKEAAEQDYAGTACSSRASCVRPACSQRGDINAYLRLRGNQVRLGL